VTSDGSALPQEQRSPEDGLAGLCIAPCCHHRCTWKAYIGKEALLKLGLTRREIELMFWMSSA
jgi:tRNA:m4X modification enzyme